jgi:hypothetical protein
VNFEYEEKKESKKKKRPNNNPFRKTKHALPLEKGDAVKNLMTRRKIIFHRRKTPHTSSKHDGTLTYFFASLARA